MQERTKVFEDLRKALRIALPEGKKGLYPNLSISWKPIKTV